MFWVSVRLRHPRRLWGWAAFVHVDIYAWSWLLLPPPPPTHYDWLWLGLAQLKMWCTYEAALLEFLSVWLTAKASCWLVEFRKRRSSDCVWRDRGHSCSVLIDVVMLRCGAWRGDWGCSEGKITDKRVADWRISAFGSSKKQLCLFYNEVLSSSLFYQVDFFALYLFNVKAFWD